MTCTGIELAFTSRAFTCAHRSRLCGSLVDHGCAAGQVSSSWRLFLAISLLSRCPSHPTATNQMVFDLAAVGVDLLVGCGANACHTVRIQLLMHFHVPETHLDYMYVSLLATAAVFGHRSIAPPPICSVGLPSSLLVLNLVLTKRFHCQARPFHAHPIEIGLFGGAPRSSHTWSYPDTVRGSSSTLWLHVFASLVCACNPLVLIQSSAP